MTLAPRNADDSCLINQTVPAGVLGPPSEHLDEKSQLPNPNPNTGEDVENGVGHSYPIENATVAPPVLPEGGDDEDDFPEGGLESWLVVVGSFCSMMSVYGIINIAAVFESYFSSNQLAGYSSSTVGWIFSVYLFIVFFAGIQVGPIFDRYGPRLLVLVGSLLVVASQMLLGLCEGKVTLYVLKFIDCAWANGLGT